VAGSNNEDTVSDSLLHHMRGLLAVKRTSGNAHCASFLYIADLGCLDLYRCIASQNIMNLTVDSRSGTFSSLRAMTI
jgi:hypothetical protein